MKQDLDDVRKVGGWLALIISGFTWPTLLAKLAGADELGPLAQVFVLTFPLTLTVLLVILVAVYGPFPKEVNDQIMLLLFIVAAPPLVSAVLGLGTGFNVIGRAFTQHHEYLVGWRTLPLRFIVAYFELYGLRNFVSSVLVGVFLGWAWIVKISPHLIKRI